MIYIRCDASEVIGWGHFKRCLILAKYLVKKTSVCFLMVQPDDAVKTLLLEENIDLLELPSGLSFSQELSIYPQHVKNIILDIGYRQTLNHPDEFNLYLKKLKCASIQTIIIDGLDDDAFRHPEAPEVLAYIQPYWGVTETTSPHSKEWFYGAEYILIDDIYVMSYHKRHLNSLNNILITFGASDPQNNTAKVLRALSVMDIKQKLKVVIGPSFSETHINEIDEICEAHNIDKVLAPSNLLDQYKWADLAICASSTSRYEAAACGLPVIFTAIYPQHVKLSKTYAQYGTSKYIGYCEDVLETDWQTYIENFLAN